ncbi:serine/threonine-protein kinase par-1-like [Cololabis saira]|uniref:serine/threonine-protein kinase par-1-like n=1 Tax=Cololabis saira TaxID=129043 RepID=UPI002AD2320D|nr:serine/threonine-protein kinase par-1-like [Cololabis saira]
MNKDLVQKSKSDCTSNQEEEACSSSATHSSAVENNTKNNKSKRSLSPDNQPPRKRRKVSEVAGSSTSYDHEEKTVRVAKRKAGEDGERPKKRAKRGNLLKLVLDQEVASSSTDTGSNLETHAIPEVAGSSTSYDHEEKTVRVAKRKAGEDGERPKKRAKRGDLLKLVLDQEVASSSTDTGSNLETHAIPEVAGSSTSYNHEEKTVRVAKRKAGEDGERPKKRAKHGDLLKLVLDQEVASSSTDTGSNLETKAIPEGDRRKKKAKRKADDEDAEETSGGKKKKKTKTQQDTTRSPRDEFQEKYEQQGLLGEGGFGSVFAGYRKSDHLQVAIKHVQNDKVVCKHKGRDGREVSVEVAAMLKLQKANSGSAGQSAAVSLLDWYDLDQELILVMERPMPSEDLSTYIWKNGGPLEEDEARIILKQLLDAAVHLQANKIFHRDIKLQNILIETGSSIPRVRLIDFGLSCFFTRRSRYRIFCGTSAHTPPEWFRNNTYTAGPTTTWQMGVVLYDTLHDTDFSSEDYLRDLIEIRDDLSEDCQDFLQKCLTLNPKKRPSLEELQRHPWFTLTPVSSHSSQTCLQS